MLFDTHAHLETYPENSVENNDVSKILTRAYTEGVRRILTIGTTLDSSREAIRIAQEKSTAGLGLWASSGIHPTDSIDDFVLVEQYDLKIEKLKSIVGSSDKVIAIGECGLDYYLDEKTGSKKSVTTSDDKKFQRKLFVSQIKIASEFGLPIIVHCRNGWDEIFEILKSNRATSGVFHSFTGGPSELKQALRLGFYVSFSGIVTFKNAKKIQEAAEEAPLDRILIETDSPFLAPEPLRGQNNEPGNVRIVASYLAKLKNMSEDDFFKQTLLNAQKLFKL